jgi:hypothetical protein
MLVNLFIFLILSLINKNNTNIYLAHYLLKFVKYLMFIIVIYEYFWKNIFFWKYRRDYPKYLITYFNKENI